MLVIIYLLSGLLFLMLLLSLGRRSFGFARPTGSILLFVCIAGVALYGYGYYHIYASRLLAIIRTVFSVFCMFLGRNEIALISSVPHLQTLPAQVFIYFVHMMALYCTASAFATILGRYVIQALNHWQIRKGPYHIIYGVSEESVSFAEACRRGSEPAPVMVGGSDAETFSDRILSMGGVLLPEKGKADPDKMTLKHLGIRPGAGGIKVSCLHEDPERNAQFARSMLLQLSDMGVETKETSLTIRLREERDGARFQAGSGTTETQYGYGSVLAFALPELVARHLIKTYPPYHTLTFDENGMALEDFEALIIGFGATGQAVLRSLIMNGQFCGSRFHAIVAARDCQMRAGHFNYKYPGLQAAYSIDILEMDARSSAFYEHLSKIENTLKYIVICTGDEKENTELQWELTDVLLNSGLSHIPILSCSDKGITKTSGADGMTKTRSFFTPENLLSSRADVMAMVLNHQYHRNEGNTAQEDWAACDYFSRMSCRASADYMDAFLYVTGSSREEALAGRWDPSPKALEVLSRTEHLRWCAFHFAMGYQRMPDEVFRQRAEQYRAEVQQTGAGTTRITKDTAHKYHACLIPWEELDELSEWEFQVTGKRTDYKASDLDNVLMVPDMLREEAKLCREGDS